MSRRGRQIYVILRADLFQGRDVEPETLVTAKAVVRSAEVAEREVARLNALHPDGRVRYWSQISRFEEPSDGPLSTDT